MKKNKSICMYSIDNVIGEKTGGVKRFFELTNYFIEEGYEVFLVSKDSIDDMKKMNINGKTLKITSDKMYGLNVIKQNKEIFKFIKEKNFDKVVVFDIRAAISLAIYNIKNINLFLRQDLLSYKKIQLESQKINGIKRFITLRLLLFSEFLCLKKSSKIIVQCKYDLDQLCIRHKFLKSKIINNTSIQINNVNPSWIENNKKNIDSNNSKYDLVFVGNFNNIRKGHNILLKAIEELYNENIIIKVAVIGDGLELEKYKKMYKKFDNIVFLGRIKNPASLIVNSKLSIVPSYADSCPNTVLESLYLNVPVIGSNRGGIPEILNNNDWLFDLNTVSLKNAIKKYLSEEWNEKIKKEQKERKKELEFNWSEKIRNILEK
ncbi:MAG: glycosyltransferase [Bacilli bacterium]|nr:glycosyltransferase [Bacilli bacterium]